MRGKAAWMDATLAAGAPGPRLRAQGAPPANHEALRCGGRLQQTLRLPNRDVDPTSSGDRSRPGRLAADRSRGPGIPTTSVASLPNPRKG